jgi:methionine-rich copper-binding protein CopC
MKFRILCVAPLLAVLGAAPALAKTTLVLAQPGPRDVVAAPPQVLLLSFSAPLQLAYCDVTVTDPGGNPVPVARPQPVAGQPDELAVPVQITQAGRYTVTWEVSAYTQRTSGRYVFTVAQ